MSEPLYVDAKTIKEYIAHMFQPDDLINLRWKYRAGDAGNELYKARDIEVIIKKIERLESNGKKDSRKEVVAYWINAQHISANFLNAGKKSVSDADIDRYILITFDHDAEKPEGHANDNSTDAEKQAAKYRMDIQVKALNELGWPEPQIVDSGNGWQSRYPVDIPASESKTIRQLLQSAEDHFKADVTLYNPARVLKLPGTPTRKGEDTPERPQRMSRILSMPTQKTLVTIEQIKAFIAKYPVKEKVEGSAQNAPSSIKSKESGRDKAKRILNANHIPYTETTAGDGRTVYYFSGAYCPNSKSHSSNGVSDAAVLVDSNDKLAFKCQHQHCNTVSWHHFRMCYDKEYKRKKTAPRIVRDTNVVDWILENNNTDICFVTNGTEKGDFYVYNGKHMEPDTLMESRKYIENRARELYEAYQYQAVIIEPKMMTVKDREMPTPEYQEALNRIKQAEKYLDGKNQVELWKLIKTRLTRRVKEFNKDKRYMCLNNGVYDLVEHRLLPHDSKYNVSMFAPVDYIPTATCPKTDALLEYQFPDAAERRYIWYVFGGALLRQVRKDCSNIYFYGPGDTGKSTLLMAVIGTLGDASKDNIGYAITRSSDFNTMRAAKRETRNDKLQTRDRMIIGIDETRKDEKQDAESIKNSSGGVMNNVRGLYSADEGMEATATTINTCNDLPMFDWDDAALVDRLLLIKFTRVLKDIKKDRPYWEVLVKEEASGILNRLLEAVKDYQTNGPPQVPPRLDLDKQEAIGDSDKVAKMIRNYMVLGKTPAHRMTLKGFYMRLEAYYTNVEHIDKKFIPGEKKILATLAKFGVTNSGNKVTRWPGGTDRNVLSGIREKTAIEIVKEEEQAAKEYSQVLHKEMPALICAYLEKQEYGSASINAIAQEIHIEAKEVTPILEAMEKRGEITKDGPNDYAIPLRKEKLDNIKAKC